MVHSLAERRAVPMAAQMVGPRAVNWAGKSAVSWAVKWDPHWVGSTAGLKVACWGSTKAEHLAAQKVDYLEFQMAVTRAAYSEQRKAASSVAQMAVR